MDQEKIASRVAKGFLRQAMNASDFKGIIKEYIDDNWTTADASWKRDAIKNLKLKKTHNLGFKTIHTLETEWERPELNYTVLDNGTQYANFEVTVRDMTLK